LGGEQVAPSTIVAAILSVSAASTTAAAEPVPAPAAVVQAHSVKNAREQVTVRVPKTSTYVGSDRFDLYGVADAEIHVFAETGPGGSSGSTGSSSKAIGRASRT
jgi:hypothetical protein